ncbi:MAG TPA: rhomboid family intramembrane serine protease [Acidimicrobiales bacterium]
MLPLHDDNPVRHTPVLTWLIVAACVAVYLLWQPDPFASTTADADFNLRNAAVPCELVEGRPLTQNEVILTFSQGDDTACDLRGDRSPAYDPDKNVFLAVVTSMFLHGSLLHLGSNMLFLWIFGNNIEDRLRPVGFALLYLAGGVVATAAHVVLNIDSTVPLVGASGAIAAVMGAYMIWYPNARVRTAVFMLFIMLVEIRAKWLLGFWFVLQFFTGPDSGVAWAAHVGGFVFGVLVALVLGGPGERQASRRPPPVQPGWPPPQRPAPRPWRYGPEDRWS